MACNILARSLALTLGLAACLGAMAQETPAPQSVKVQGVKDPSRWKRAESPHFVVYSDAAGEDVRRLMNDLERLDHVLRVYLHDHVEGLAPAHKVALYLPGRERDFTGILGGVPGKTVGLYNSCPAGVQGFGVISDPVRVIATEDLGKQALNEGQSYIFEAYARHFIYRYTGIRTPASFIDGVAQFFAGVRFSETHALLGRVPEPVSRYLGFLHDTHSRGMTYRAVLDDVKGKWSRDAGPADGDEDGAALEYRAKALLLTHFMLSSPERRQQTKVYLDLVRDGQAASAAFEQAFGMKVAAADGAMEDYWRKASYMYKVDFKLPAAVPIAMDTLTRAAGDVVLASAQLKSCPDRKTGTALLDQLRREPAQAASNPFVLLTLSRAQIDWGNPDDAVGPLTALLATNPRDPEALLLLGLAHLRLASSATADARAARLDTARRYLKQARALDPGAPEAAYWLSRAELEDSATPDELALTSAIHASRNAPEAGTLARTAALAYAYTGRADEAAIELTLLAQNGADPTTAAWATDWQRRLAAGVPRTELVAEMRREPAAQAFREWTFASGDVMRTIACNNDLIDSRKRIEAKMVSAPKAEREVLQDLLWNLPRSCVE